MFVLEDANDFIDYYEKAFGLKIIKIEYQYKRENVGLLCVKKGNRAVSLPHLSYGAIETNCQTPIPNKFKGIEIRDTIPHNQKTYNQKVVFETNLNSYDFQLPKNVLRKINKAIKNNIEVKELREWDKNNKSAVELLNDFHKVYSFRMHKIGVPALSKKQIINRMETKHYSLFIAYYYGKAIGGASLNKITNRSYENELIATNTEYNKLYTSYILHNTMINSSKQEDCEVYSMGRSTRDSNVYYYKKHWGFNEINLFWSNNKRDENTKLKSLLPKIWRLLPINLAKLIGPIIHKLYN